MSDSDCNHQWEEVFDSKAYNDGFYVTTGYLCKKCGAEKGVSKTTGSNQMKWFPILVLFPFSIIFIILFEMLTMIGVLYASIREMFYPKKKPR